jgi:hypothetical protein
MRGEAIDVAITQGDDAAAAVLLTAPLSVAVNRIENVRTAGPIGPAVRKGRSRPVAGQRPRSPRGNISRAWSLRSMPPGATSIGL